MFIFQTPACKQTDEHDYWSSAQQAMVIIPMNFLIIFYMNPGEQDVSSKWLLTYLPCYVTFSSRKESWKQIKNTLLHVCAILANQSCIFQLQLYSHQPIHNHQSRDKQED